MREFDGTPGEKSEEALLVWMGAHPDGFVLNFKGHQAPMLHRAHCGHFKGFTSPVDLTKSKKVCSLNRDALVRHGKAEFGDVRICGSCRP